ncbi:superoxide dismutase, partial [Streptomyces sp. GC420]|uniref:superoxide dismutase n=1 Tax=Streptomyces sp. GC420 TaxID=2697568 RepID=UPI001414DB98
MNHDPDPFPAVPAHRPRWRGRHPARPRDGHRAGQGATAGTPATAATAGTAGTAGTEARWPAGFPLPDGFRPEGITIGSGPYAWVGSLGTGAVYRADLRTGRGRVVLDGASGTAAVGMKLDHDGLLYIAGGADGTARVLDTRTGELVATHRPAGPTGHFVNDVTLLGDRARFTDSRDGALHGIPRGTRGTVTSLRLGGDWQQAPDVINANGIVPAPGGRGLIVVSSRPVGRLYHVGPKTGHAAEIALRGADDVLNGDGLLRIGRRLYVVQNRLNRISVFDLGLEAGLPVAALRGTITDP